MELRLSTEQLVCTARSEPGSYAFDDGLVLHIRSSIAPWRLRMQMTALKQNGDDDEELEPRTIELKIADEWVPVWRPLTAARSNRSVDRELRFAVRVTTGEALRAGKYEGKLRLGLEHPSGKRVPVQEVPLSVTVGTRAKHKWRGNRIYFHCGAGSSSQTALVEGTVEANAPLLLKLEVDEGCVGELPMVRKMYDYTPQGRPIPVEWTLKERRDRKNREPDIGAADDRWVAWRLRQTPGKSSYQLSCTIKPRSAQAPGEYMKSLTLSVVPEI
jgi:hypothetical protein